MTNRRNLDFIRRAKPAVPVPIALGAHIWWDPSVNYTLDGMSRVSNFVDRIQGFDAFQGTDTRRPDYNSSDANFSGRPSMTYAAINNQSLSTGAVAALLGLSSLELFATRYVAAGPAGTQTFFQADGAVSDAWFRVTTLPDDNTFVRDTLSATAGATVAAGAATGVQWVNMWVDATTVSIESSLGGPTTNAAPGGVFDMDRYTIGSNVFDGEIGDIIVFPRKLTAGERTQMQAFMATRI